MRAAKAVLAGAILFGLLAVPALGEDIYPPWWRGETETTFEQWEFLTNMNPTPPDPPWVNPYGEPSLIVFPAFPPPDDWFPEYLGGLGVWLRRSSHENLKIQPFDLEQEGAAWKYRCV